MSARRAARVAGVLYIVGTVAGVLSKVAGASVSSAADPLGEAAKHSGATVTTALLVLLMGLSLAFIPVVLFPVLRKIDETLAIGYLIVRGAIETTCYVIIAVGWLLLAPLHGVVATRPGTALAHLRDVLTANGVLALVFCLGAAMFYTLLYRSGIVPRWIAGWGLGAIPLYVAADLLGMYGTVGIDSTAQSLLFAPLAIQEMVLAVWLIARGFLHTPAPGSAETPSREDGRTVAV